MGILGKGPGDSPKAAADARTGTANLLETMPNSLPCPQRLSQVGFDTWQEGILFTSGSAGA